MFSNFWANLLLTGCGRRRQASPLIALFLSLIQVLLLAQTPSTAFTSHSARPPEQLTLPNGLKIVLLEDHSFPVVSTQVWYRVGSRNETLGSTGISHLVEHLLFRNVGSFRKNELGATIARNGGQFNGYTSDDFTTFFETLPPSKLDLALRIEADRMHSATFVPAEVKEEINNIQAEFERDSKDYSEQLSREVRAIAYQQHPYHNPTMGWKNDVENLTIGHIKSFYEQHFRPDNATLVVAGDFQSAEAIALIKKHFGAIAKPSTPLPIIRSVEPPQRGERRVSMRYLGKQEALELAYHAPAIKDLDAPAMTVIEKLLNASINGRLKTALLDSKLSTSALSALETKQDPGLFIITSYAAPGVTQQKLLEAIDGTMNQLKSQPLSDGELKRAKNQAEFAYLAEVDGPYRAGFHLGFFDTLVNWKTAYEWSDRLKAVTAADVQRTAKKYFNNDNRVVGWLSSPNAPKPAPPKPAEPAKPTKPQEPAKPAKPAEPAKPSKPGKPPKHIHMTGYKLDDAQVAPGGSSPATPAPAAVAPQSPAPAQPQAQTPPPNDTFILRKPQQRILKNGIKVVVYESHISPIINIAGAIRAGDAVDPAGKKGISLLATSMLNNGSSKHTRSQLLNMQEDLGLPTYSMLKFEPGPEYITFKSKCFARDVASQVGMVAECAAAQSFTEEEGETAWLDRAKSDAINTLKHTDESTESRVQRALWQSVIAPNTSFYPAEQSDRLNSITKLEPADVKSFFSQFVTPDATTIVFVGDISIDQAAQVVERQTASWTGKTAAKRVAVQHSTKRVLRTFIPTTDKSKSLITVGQIFSFTRQQPDYAALLLADCALNNHPFLSRIAQRFYNEPALAESPINDEVESELEPLGNVTSWSLRLQSDAETVSPAVQLLLGELRKLSRTGLTAEEINEAKRYLLGAIPVRQLSTTNSVSNTLLESVMQSPEPQGLAPLVANIRAAGSESVNRFIKNVFKPEQSSLVLAGDTTAIKAVRKALSPPRNAVPAAAAAH